MKETMVDTTVTYTLEHKGKLYVIERVPARVCQETGEELFSPDTVEYIQTLIKSGKRPDRVIETPVFEYAYKGAQQKPPADCAKHRRVRIT